jgi:hypothetical protein
MTEIEDYNNKLDGYMQSIINNQIILELTKCCGYSEFLPIFKSFNLSELHKFVKHKLERNDDIKLFAVNNLTIEKLLIPNDDNNFIKDFINEYKLFFQPLYPVPARVVYRVYYDSGCCHTSEHSNLIFNSECIIHK